jgi:hypothetical protein
MNVVDESAVRGNSKVFSHCVLNSQLKMKVCLECCTTVRLLVSEALLVYRSQTAALLVYRLVAAGHGVESSRVESSRVESSIQYPVSE